MEDKVLSCLVPGDLIRLRSKSGDFVVTLDSHSTIRLSLVKVLDSFEIVLEPVSFEPIENFIRK